MRFHPRLLVMLFALFCLSPLAAAQTSVKCESNDGRRNYCGNFQNSRITMSRQISGSACIQGQTWGVDNTGLWVDRGCRAYFNVTAGRGDNRDRDHDRDRDRRDSNFGVGPSSGPNASSVRCESNDGGRNYCGAVNGGVSMVRQISGSPCIQGQTWGVDNRGLWVDRGCRADFSVAVGGGDRRDYGRPGEGGGWWHRDAGDTWPPRGDWRGGRWEQGGACFYRDRNYGGDYFCMRRGEERPSMDQIEGDVSSIRVFGGARVMVFDDPNFSGANEFLNGDATDLRQVAVRQKPGHTWNNRIHSIRVR